MAIELALDNQDLEQFSATAAAFGSDRFGYVVTPNVDHVIRLHDDAGFRSTYDSATFVLLDSRLLSRLLRLINGQQLRVCTGSDLTTRLFEQVIAPDDRIVMVGGSDEQAALLREKFELTDLRHENPPMGFIRDAAAVDQVVQFVEAQSPFRFCLLAVGAPQQELLAQKILERGKARGLALCIGASVNFLTGGERRAPRWMQALALEWLFRLLQSPGRLGKRYLVRGPRIFRLLKQTRIRVRGQN
jgi:exopolysaccharide biosynthesis WecB/TagA/CpsF family protein